mmetsp:Transcript_1642/g.3681  ORF Transcript_1642/g.3681 Transcript_1642/m.3681 type:complete len:348 (+) Transcript_1642:624-1667(+)
MPGRQLVQEDGGGVQPHADGRGPVLLPLARRFRRRREPFDAEQVHGWNSLPLRVVPRRRSRRVAAARHPPQPEALHGVGGRDAHPLEPRTSHQRIPRPLLRAIDGPARAPVVRRGQRLRRADFARRGRADQLAGVFPVRAAVHEQHGRAAHPRAHARRSRRLRHGVDVQVRRRGGEHVACRAPVRGEGADGHAGGVPPAREPPSRRLPARVPAHARGSAEGEQPARVPQQPEVCSGHEPVSDEERDAQRRHARRRRRASLRGAVRDEFAWRRGYDAHDLPAHLRAARAPSGQRGDAGMASHGARDGDVLRSAWHLPVRRRSRPQLGDLGGQRRTSSGCAGAVCAGWT